MRVRNPIAGCWISGRLGKISLELRRGVDGKRSGVYGLDLALAGVTGEPEELVLPVHYVRNDHRPAQGNAELVPLEHLLGHSVAIIEIAIGIKGLIAQEIINTPVDVVGAGLGDDAHDATGVAPVFRRVVAGQNAKLGDGVRDRVVDDFVPQQVVVDAPIQQVGDGIRLAAGDPEGAGLAPVRGAGVHFRDAGLEKSEIQNVTAVERQVHGRSGW